MNDVLDNPWGIIYLILSVVALVAIAKLLIEGTIKSPVSALKVVLILFLPVYILKLTGYGEYSEALFTFLLIFLAVRSHK